MFRFKKILLSVLASILVHSSMAQTPYVVYVPGNTNIILSAPHGGNIDAPWPARIPGCHDSASDTCTYNMQQSCSDSVNCGVTTVTDSNTILLAEAVAAQIEAQLGAKPHLIYCNIERDYVDMNREIGEACCGMSQCEQYYNEYHGYIRQAQFAVGRGILFDIHGQNHGFNSTELGYVISSTDLNNGDYNSAISTSSIKLLYEENRGSMTGEDLLIGPDSFGAYVEAEGFKAVPSDRQNSPGQDKYFTGGYITKTYGSRDGGLTDAIQCETPYEIRSDDPVRDAFGVGLGNAIVKYRNKYINL